MAAGGWLGGHLAYGMGVGVDTNAFESGPDDWTRAQGDAPGPGGLAKVVADGVRVVVADTPEGLRGLADRCSHRGGPLSDGEKVGNCVVCPWHGSRFELSSGAVERGPASVPQPTYEIRSEGSGVELRRSEPRALRRRAVH